MSRNLDTWYSLPDLDHLARLGKALEGEPDLGKLSRLVGLLSSPVGAVNASMTVLSRADGILELRLECSAQVQLTCQRCLEPMSYRLEASVRYEVVEEGPEEGNDGGHGVPERLALNGRRVNPLQLIEEELIVALPFSPRHERKAKCGNLARRIDELSIDGGEDQVDVSVDH